MTIPTVQDLPFTTGHSRQEEPSDARKLETVRPCVLVVEDDPSHRELLVEILTTLGYEPVPVGSAEEAEYAARRRPLSAALVDVFLPGKSGAAVVTKLRERFPEAVIIGMSALGDAGVARRLKIVGADLFIHKPIDPEKLSEALQSEHQSWH